MNVTTEQLIARLNRADEYEAIGTDAWAAAAELTRLQAVIDAGAKRESALHEIAMTGYLEGFLAGSVSMFTNIGTDACFVIDWQRSKTRAALATEASHD